MRRHVHADLMIEYANDSSIEIEVFGDLGHWVRCVNPTFNLMAKYRKKAQPKKYISMWQWVIMGLNGVPFMSSRFYKSEEDVFASNRRAIIQRADWTRIEVEVKQ